MNNWISCMDKLPEKDGMYLVTVEYSCSITPLFTSIPKRITRKIVTSMIYATNSISEDAKRIIQATKIPTEKGMWIAYDTTTYNIAILPGDYIDDLKVTAWQEYPIPFGEDNSYKWNINLK